MYDFEYIKRECRGISGIVYFENTDSTNMEARRLAADGAEDGVLILAGNQTKGRGRLGRTWNNSGDDAIAMSLLLRPLISPDRISMITIIAALAVSEGIEKSTGLKTSVKWPNDLKAGDRKICGILSESVFCGRDFYSVLGIGINVNNDSFPDEIKDIAGSVSQFTRKKESRERIITESINSFFRYYEILGRDGNLGRLIHEYNAKCITEGGINEFGELIMTDGSLKRSGEV